MSGDPLSVVVHKEFVDLFDALFILFGILFVVGCEVAALCQNIVDNLLQTAAASGVIWQPSGP